MGCAPDNSKLSTFGCAEFIHKPKECRAGKVDDKDEKGMYLGTTLGYYPICFPEIRTVESSKHVTFDESIYPSMRRKETRNDIDQYPTSDSAHVSSPSQTRTNTTENRAIPSDATPEKSFVGNLTTNESEEGGLNEESNVSAEPIHLKLRYPRRER